jgi:tRNA pseudouridine38-40 synthase
MPRYKLTIEYDGMPYKGWQRQEGLPTVQAAIEKAMSQFAQHEVLVFGAGRTDAGVHARGQVIHVDFEKTWQSYKIMEATNGLLKLAGHPISVLHVEEAADDFDARFSAKYRSYKYRIINRRAPLTVDLERALWVRFPLDVDAMHEAAQELVGEYDFTTFRSTDCQAKSPIRTLDKLDVNRISETEIEIIAEARAFLHNQIRSFAGTLRLVGDGKWSKQDLVDALHAKDRTRCGPVAVPYGLYFMKVGY